MVASPNRPPLDILLDMFMNHIFNFDAFFSVCLNTGINGRYFRKWNCSVCCLRDVILRTILLASNIVWSISGSTILFGQPVLHRLVYWKYCKVCLKSPGTDVGAAGFGMGVPGLLRQTLVSRERPSKNISQGTRGEALVRDARDAEETGCAMAHTEADKMR